MSIREIIKLERELFAMELVVSLTDKGDGILIEGPIYADLLIAKTEIQNRRDGNGKLYRVVGYKQRTIEG